MLSDMHAYREWQKKLEASGYRVVHEPAVMNTERPVAIAKPQVHGVMSSQWEEWRK